MFKDNLKKLREEVNLTQEELAEKLYVSRSAVAKWEQGRGIPKTETIEEIAKVFKVPIDSFYEKNEPQKVIEKIEKNNKRVVFIFCMIIIALISLLFIIGSKKGDKIEYDNFYSQDALESYGLKDLKPVIQNSIGSVNWNDNYYVNIEGEDVFREYVNYIFNYLQNSPYISYVGFNVEKPIEGSSLLDNKNYILNSDNLEDYNDSTFFSYGENNSTSYTFYYLTVLNMDRQPKDSLDLNFISIDYQKEITSWIEIKNVKFKTNFRMHIHSTKNYGPLGDFYLFHEHFDIEKIEINQNNFHDYFYINCSTANPGYSWYTIKYKEIYYFRAFVPLTLEIGEDENYESKKTIVYKPSYGDYIKLIRAYGEYDLSENIIKYKYNVIVEQGYIYRVKTKK